MIYTIIVMAVIFILAVILAFALYNWGFISFYHPMKEAQPNQIRVACVGDSITFGCTVKNWRKNNYPKVLGNLLGRNYCVNNFGYSNRTAIKSGDFPYTREKLYRQSLAFRPDLVVIMLGTNDSKRNNWNKEKFISDYCEIIHSYLSLPSKPKIYILSPLPIFEFQGKIMWQLRKDVVDNEICPAVEQIAQKMDIPFMDMHEVFENHKELFSDGVHPNAKGSKLFAQRVYEVIC